MSFVSIEFAFAALVFLPLYWSLRAYRDWQILLLTASGYLLYGTWSQASAVVLFFFSAYVWVAGNWINSATGTRMRRLLLSVGITISILVLLVYKYYEFVRQSASDVMQSLGLEVLLPVVDVAVPAGISFFTFQAISYLIWQGQSPPQRTPFTKLLLYLAFWPTHFAGPIFRAQDFFRQLENEEFGAPVQTPWAIYFIFLGLVEKMVCADWLAHTFVDDAFKYPDAQTAISTLAAVVAYSLQIFLDFSGYTLVVTGLGLLLGFVLPVNFRQPYIAANLREFWRRWHISLSSFIRDYVYIPLGGSRRGYFRTQMNIMAAMLISGLWHGANYNFLIWGFLHGFGAVCQNLFEKAFGRTLPAVISHALTFSYVGFAWIFFRADSTEAAMSLIGGFARDVGELNAQHYYLMAFTLLFFLCSMRIDAIEQMVVNSIRRHRGWRLVSAATIAVFFVVLLGPSGVPGFIYYRF